MDGWHRTGLDDAFPIRQAIPVWLTRAQFFIEKKGIIVDTT